MDEAQGVVPQRKIRAQVHRALQFRQRWLLAAAQPQRPPHGPMRGGVAVVGGQALACGLVRQLHSRVLLAPALKSVLPMRERQPGVRAGIRRVQPHRHLEETSCLRIVRLVEAVHVPKSAMVRRPGVQRIGWREDGALALGGFNFDFDRGNDSVADLVQRHKGVVHCVIEGFCPHDAGGPGLDKRHVNDDPPGVPAQQAADHEVHVQRSAGLFRPHAALVQGEHRALSNDEQAAQLGQAGDDVVGQAIAQPSPHPVARRCIRERHDRDRRAPGLALAGFWRRRERCDVGRCCRVRRLGRRG
ncbi:hypothetical protein D3C72_1335790 [compost metagenome]